MAERSSSTVERHCGEGKAEYLALAVEFLGEESQLKPGTLDPQLEDGAHMGVIGLNS